MKARSCIVGLAVIGVTAACGGTASPDASSSSPDSGAAEDGQAADLGTEQNAPADAPWPEASADAAISAACPVVAPGLCRVHLHYGDSVDGVIEVEAVSSSRLLVTDAPDTEAAWTEAVVVLEDGTLEMTSGVPPATCASVMNGFAARDPALTLEPMSGYSCDEFRMALAHYFVMQWFYFG